MVPPSIGPTDLAPTCNIQFANLRNEDLERWIVATPMPGAKDGFKTDIIARIRRYGVTARDLAAQGGQCNRIASLLGLTKSEGAPLAHKIGIATRNGVQHPLPEFPL